MKDIKTLLLALQIVDLLRSREAADRNAERISEAALKLYEKFAVFAETHLEVGRKIESLASAYQKASGQLSTGRGNIVRQLESLKELGIRPSKPIPSQLRYAEERETS